MEVLNKPRAWLAFLFCAGLLHWLVYFYLAYPEGGDRAWMGLIHQPQQWFSVRAFDAHDWYKDINFLRVLKEAIRTRTLPFHSPDLSVWAASPNGSDRFLATLVYPWSPQILLLSVLGPSAFIPVNLMLMYAVGFWGALLLRKVFGLGAMAFTFFFLIFNFNGYFVTKISVYPSSMFGYFLMPFFLWAVLRSAETPPAAVKEHVRLGVFLGLTLAGMVYQGTFHLFVECVTFLFVWVISDFKRWRVPIVACITAGLTAAARLLPAVVSFGPGASPHAGQAGYPSPNTLVEGLTAIRTQFVPPLFCWHEYSLYVSLIGTYALIYFGLWGPFMRSDWVRFHGWRAVWIPCAVLLVISCGYLKLYIIPNWIPLLNAESVKTRYMIIPLLMVAAIASINLQGFLKKYGSVQRVKALIAAAGAGLAYFLFNNTRVWRMHKIQVEYDQAVTSGLTPPSPEIWPQIQNELSDTVYIQAFWVGCAVSLCALVFLTAAWIRQRKARHEQGVQPS
ncbi:MAG: hypothetical protein HYY14_02420 [Candidatus Omnitrophica bacterium]|nr:hypothetical protein [Candidatus Omnitrophota bacterium]